MTAARWDVSFDADDQTPAGRSIPTLVSLHFVRSALRRRWWVCALCALLGLLISVGFLVASATSHQAKAALVLAHDPQVDPSRAMATDVSLLGTRTVASKTIDSLGLTMTPDDFLRSITLEPVGSELLSLTLTGPSDAEAVRRLTALTSVYLDFRAEQLSVQSNVLVDGMQQRIDTLQSEVATISRRIGRLSKAGRSSSQLSDAIAQRATIQGQIETLQQSVEDATLRNASVVSSSRVIDPASVDAAGAQSRVALALGSGLIGGAALGCGIVLFFAITSDRLRRRSDVAAALEVPVPVSVGKIAAVPRHWLWVPHIRTLNRRRGEERQRLAHAMELELPVPGRSGRLAVVCIDNADEVRFAVASAATDLSANGRSVALVDLTQEGVLNAAAVPSIPGSTQKPTLLRPRGIPALAGGVADLQVVGQQDGRPPSLESADVTLLLADLDPSVGVNHLTAWTDRVVIAVTAGRSSAELVRTAAELVQTAGLESRFGVLLHAERTDDSSGAGSARSASGHALAGQDTVEAVAESVDEKQGSVEAQALTDRAQQPAADEQEAEEQQATAKDELVAEPTTSDEDPTAEMFLGQEVTIDDQPTAKGQPAEEQPATTDEELVTEEQAPAEEELIAKEQLTEEKPPTGEEQLAEEQSAEEQQSSADEELILKEQATVNEELTAEEQAGPDQKPAAKGEIPEANQLTSDEQPTAEEQLTEEEPLAQEQQAAGDERSPTEEQQATTADQPGAEESRSEDKQAIADQEQPSDQRPVAAVHEQPSGEELPVDQDPSTAEQRADGPNLVVEDTDRVATLGGLQVYLADILGLDEPDTEEASAAIGADDHAGPIAEPDEVPNSESDAAEMDGWDLYLAADPSARPVAQVTAEADQDRAERPAGNGQKSNGHGLHDETADAESDQEAQPDRTSSRV